MKARIRNVTTFKMEKSAVKLSIGMIVKNEERHLDNCLSALQKLRDRVENELIIVDTGSTDRTKEIAKKYTDKVYDFEWIDDFAAARNFGLEKAVGEWFMFLDADEYMDENCEPLIEFFNNSALNSKYFSATFIIRGYNRSDMEQYDDFPAIRIVRRNDKTRFEGNIHEKLMWYSPLYNINVPFHHFGYIMDENNNCYQKKVERNRPLLMKKYEQNPKDIQCICEILDISNKKDEELKWCDILSELIKLPENKHLRNLGYRKILRVYLRYKMCDEALDTAQKYLSHEGNENNACVLFVYTSMARIYRNIGRDEQAAECYEKYFSAYEKYRKNELDTTDLVFAPVYGCSDSEYKDVSFEYIDWCISGKRYDRALEVLGLLGISGGISDISDNDPEPMKNSFFGSYIKIAENLSDFSVMKPVLEKADAFSENMRECLVDNVFYAFCTRLSDREVILGQVEVFSPVSELYMPLKLIAEYENGADVTDRLHEFSDKFSDGGGLINARCPELMYICLKTGFDLTGSIDKAEFSDILFICSCLAPEHDDLAAVLIGYFEIMPPATNIRTMLFYVNALTAAAADTSSYDDDDKRTIYDNFTTILSDYVLNVYNPQLFDPEDIVVLPELHRFGYYMALAATAKNEGKQLEYVRALRAALKSCPSMKTVIEFYINDLSL